MEIILSTTSDSTEILFRGIDYHIFCGLSTHIKCSCDQIHGYTNGTITALSNDNGFITCVNGVWPNTNTICENNKSLVYINKINDTSLFYALSGFCKSNCSMWQLMYQLFFPK